MRKIFSSKLKMANQELNGQVDLLVNQWVKENFRNPRPVDFDMMKNLALKVSNLILEYATKIVPSTGTKNENNQKSNI